MNSFTSQQRKTGYLGRISGFFIKDQTKREFSYHYHDFHKVIIFLSGKAAYHIEGKLTHLKPWDILLNRHAIHKPEIDFRFHTNVLYYGSVTTSNHRTAPLFSRRSD